MADLKNDSLFEQEMLRGGYERLIAKPPPNIGSWPLSKVICFKEAVYAANSAFDRASTGRNRRYILRFMGRVRLVTGFYQEDGDHVD